MPKDVPQLPIDKCGKCENSGSQGTQPSELTKKKNPGNKNQGWEPIHQKYKANENTSRHNPKKKQKQTINKK